MIIDRNLAKFIIFDEERIVDALQKITDNKVRAVLSVSQSGRIQGVLTDGDFRRWLVTQENLDLATPVRDVANQDFFSLPASTPPDLIRGHLTDRVHIIPLVDEQQHIVAVARQSAEIISLAGRKIDKDSPVFVIAEVGNNHNGDPALARQLIDVAAASGADCIKFQMRNMETLYTNAGSAEDPSQDLGAQYTLDLLSRFNLDKETLYELFDYTRKQGAIPLCTPWDIDSANAFNAYGMEGFKIASADLTNHALLGHVASFGKPIILSTGMSRESEIIEAARLLEGLGSAYILLHCNSTYPTPFKDVNLRYLKRIHQIGSEIVGYSGHERGYHIPLAAVALGAKVVEKHITLDREMEGSDHKVSLLPDEFSSMVLQIRDLEEAIGDDQLRSLSQGEIINRETLAKSLVAARTIQEGEFISDNMVIARGPGSGIQPNRLHELVGKHATRLIEADTLFMPSDLGEVVYTAKPFSFKRPWGIPVRYHDVQSMLAEVSPDFVEYHLSYKDMELSPGDMLTQQMPTGFAVHSPELFSGDHILDLSAQDKTYRNRSLSELQRVIDVTREMIPFHSDTETPVIITNVGGFSEERPLPKEERRPLYEMIADGLNQLDADGVEIIPQTMPPFPWHFGGQRHHNLFVDADEIQWFCETYGVRVCLDISHSKLACSHTGASFDEFIELIGPHTAHLHIVDAEGVDGEGLQIGDGEIDFAALSRQLTRVAPNAGFIPEVWQGHKNGGQGFWQALTLLEQWY